MISSGDREGSKKFKEVSDCVVYLPIWMEEEIDGVAEAVYRLEKAERFDVFSQFAIQKLLCIYLTSII